MERTKLSSVEMNCIELAHDRNEGCDFLLEIINLRISYYVIKIFIFLISNYRALQIRIEHANNCFCFRKVLYDIETENCIMRNFITCTLLQV
jgi:cellobiose phosphorylase